MARRALALLVLVFPLSARALSPEEYLKLALASSPEVRQAEESWIAADAAYKAQFASMVLPTLSISLQTYPYGHDPSRSYRFHSWRLSGTETSRNTQVNWNLFNGFKDLLGVRLAAESRDSAAYSLDEARQSRALAALRAYYRLDSGARLRAVARDDLAAQEEQYRQTQGMYRSGLKSLSDLYKSENERHSSEMRLVSAEASYKGALAPFNELIGRAPWEESELRGELAPGATELPRLEEDAARLGERRQDLARARVELERASLQQKQTLLGLLPQLSANASWSRQDTGFGGLPASSFGIPNPNHQVGLTLSLPVGFNAATQGFNYAASRAELRRARAAFDGALRNARTELYSSWLELQRAVRVHELSVRQEEIAARGLEIVETQYRQGGADALRMAQARADLLSARVQRATALQDIFLNRASYKRAAGVRLW